MRIALLAGLPLVLTGCAASLPPPPVVPTAPVTDAASETRVLDRSALARLLANKGVTLQWLSWDQRGTAFVREENGTVRLTASQAKTGAGRLFIDGRVTEIGGDHFTLEGTIRIEDAPDPGRRCEATRSWHFAVTQNRPYWRLREFEWCDGLTDYIDIYF
ncbi:hypothetical protein [Qipengyuania sediminis]|uniref:hypothetical protein n=1 Tax=Qipengyuania sediminis TaxID=1532023 RepID=UPI001059F99F|nr:hypothetical protein [Qipengyuania sediminis]